jgi:putative two-component system response regulator
MSDHKILLIEDEQVLSKLYGDLLALKGYRVETAANVNEALGKLAANLPDLILSDIMMPEIDGVEGCIMIREQFGAVVPLLFVSALEDSETIRRAFDAGGDDYLTKQSSLEDVISRVELWLDTPPGERAAQTARFKDQHKY